MGNTASASAKPSGSAVPAAAIAASSSDASAKKPPPNPAPLAGPTVATVDAAASKPAPLKPKAPNLKAAEEDDSKKPAPKNVASASVKRSDRAVPAAASVHLLLADMDKKEKEHDFLKFTQVLMWYLEQCDHEMHAKAKAIIEEYSEKDTVGQPIYQDIISSTEARLRSTVGKVYWKKAHEYLDQHLADMETSLRSEIDNLRAMKSKLETRTREKKAASSKAKTVKKKGRSAKAAAPGARK